MKTRWWQVGIAGLSVGVMVYVLIVYGFADDAPTTPTASQPHVGAQHHSNAKHEGDQPAPIQPFANANVGDWLAYETSTQLASTRPKVSRSMVVIEAVDDQYVTLVRREREASLEPPTVTRDRRPRTDLSVDDLVGNRADGWTLHGLAVGDDSYEVGGRFFPCKKLTFSLIEPLDPSKRASVEAWFSPDVPVDGMVQTRQTLEGVSLTITNRLLGFGTADAVTWGTRPDGL